MDTTSDIHSHSITNATFNVVRVELLAFAERSHMFLHTIHRSLADLVEMIHSSALVTNRYTSHILLDRLYRSWTNIEHLLKHCSHRLSNLTIIGAPPSTSPPRCWQQSFSIGGPGPCAWTECQSHGMIGPSSQEGRSMQQRSRRNQFQPRRNRTCHRGLPPASC